MKVTLTPPLRSQFEMAAMEQRYTSRLLELFGSEANALQANNEWAVHKLPPNHWTTHTQPPIYHWATYNAIARMEAVADLLPSERKLMVAKVEF